MSKKKVSQNIIDQHHEDRSKPAKAAVGLKTGKYAAKKNPSPHPGAASAKPDGSKVAGGHRAYNPNGAYKKVKSGPVQPMMVKQGKDGEILGFQENSFSKIRQNFESYLKANSSKIKHSLYLHGFFYVIALNNPQDLELKIQIISFADELSASVDYQYKIVIEFTKPEYISAYSPLEVIY